MKRILIILACLPALKAQSYTYGSVARPGATIDFRNASRVLPDRHLTADPPACLLGERYFNTTMAKTRRCTAADTWSDETPTIYSLPAATAAVLGGVKVGAGLAIDGGGVLSVDSGTAGCDPTDPTRGCWVEDFVTGTTTSGQVGQHGMKWSAVASGTATYPGISSNAITQHPGVFAITSTSAANSGGTLQFGSTGNSSQFNVADLMSKDWSVTWIVKLASTSDVRVRIGMSNQDTNLVPGTGGWQMYFRYDTDAAFGDNGKNSGSGSWVSQLCGYNSGTCGDTGGVYHVSNTAPTTNWTALRIAHVAATDTYTWSVNGVVVSTMCASGCNMTTPTVSSQSSIASAPLVAFGISGTTQRAIWVDWFHFRIAGLARY